MPEITLAHLKKRGNIYKEVVDFETGFVNDGVFGIIAEGKKFQRIKKGVINCESAGIFGDNTDMGPRIAIVYALAKVKFIDFNLDSGGEILITTPTVIPNDKVFKISKGTQIKTTGAGSLIGGIFQIEDEYGQCFTGTKNIQPFDFARQRLSVNWFGANNGFDENGAMITLAGQVIINSDTISRDLFFPSKIYNCQTPCLFTKFSAGNYQQVFINLKGNDSSRMSNASTLLQFTDKQSIGIGIQQGKGCTIDGLAVWGAYTPSFSSFKQFVETKLSEYGAAQGARDNRFSPNCGISIDPFKSNDNGNGYPSLATYYKGGATGSGSTGIVIRNCSVKNWVVGVGYSLNAETQNCDSMVIEQCTVDQNKVCLAYGQDQTKNCVVRDIICWGNVHTFLTNNFYGAGHGAPPFVDGVSFAGYVNQVAFCVTNGRVGFKMQNIFAESLYRIGYISGQPTTISDSIFNFIMADYPGTIGAPDTYFTGENVVFQNSVLRLYDNFFNKRLAFQGENISFDHCRFDLPPIFQLQDTIRMRNVFSKCKYGNNSVILSNKTDMRLQNINLVGGSILYGDIKLEMTIATGTKTFEISENDYEAQVQLTLKDIIVNSATRTATFPLGYDPGVGSYVYVNTTATPVATYDNATLFLSDPVVGKVVGYSAGQVQLADVNIAISTGNYFLGFKYTKSFVAGFFSADFDNTLTLKNVEGDTYNIVGNSFSHEHKSATPSSFNSTTKQAPFAGETGIAADVVNMPAGGKLTIRHFYPPWHGNTLPDVFVTRGTVWHTKEIINGIARDTTYDITRSGYINKALVPGSIKQAEWAMRPFIRNNGGNIEYLNLTTDVWGPISTQNVQTEDAFTLSGPGGSRAVAANNEVIKIYLKPTTDMRIDIGTTTGGFDVYNGNDAALPVLTANKTRTLIVSIPFDLAGTLFFTGDFNLGNLAVRIIKITIP